MKYKTVLFKRMDLWTMSGMCCCISVFFMMKYIFFYGITRPFMKMDGIEPPDHPKCVGRIHCYSELWRYFDVGLHSFMHRYKHPSVEMDLSLKIEVHDQTIWNSTPEL